jgi:hypothetical protein
MGIVILLTFLVQIHVFIASQTFITISGQEGRLLAIDFFSVHPEPVEGLKPVFAFFEPVFTKKAQVLISLL